MGTQGLSVTTKTRRVSGASTRMFSPHSTCTPGQTNILDSGIRTSCTRLALLVDDVEIGPKRIRTVPGLQPRPPGPQQGSCNFEAALSLPASPGTGLPAGSSPEAILPLGRLFHPDLAQGWASSGTGFAALSVLGGLRHGPGPKSATSPIPAAGVLIAPGRMLPGPRPGGARLVRLRAGKSPVDGPADHHRW